jgi:hypothetical protein
MAPDRRLVEARGIRPHTNKRRSSSGRGELRSREYEKDGVSRRIWECKAYRIAKLDRVECADENGRDEEAADDGPPF